MLLWDSPPQHEHNGIIRHYKIVITENDTGLVQNLRTTDSMYALHNLHPYYLYIIQVQAVTVVAGEPSEELVVKTLEDSKHNNIVYNSIKSQV